MLHVFVFKENLKVYKLDHRNNLLFSYKLGFLFFSLFYFVLLLFTIWSLEKVSGKWKRGLIIKIPKKVNLRECKNSRGVTLLPVVSNILG